ncbi:hypothetical protein OQ435_13800 [Proteus penneri]|nr:hypothetical protein [Proteus penneri]MCX2589243.1 hypothetical protein [Proteus penneri]
MSLGEKEKAKYCFDQVVKNINDETIKEKAIVYLESLKDIPLIVIDESKDE